MKCFIRTIAAAVPEKCLSNDDLAKIVDTSDEWIVSHTGIKNRHIAEDDVATSDLATQACVKTLEAAGLNPEAIDLIIVATTTQDYIGYPSTACIIQNNLSASNAGAFDLAAACTGFIYSLETAKNFIKAGSAKNILVVGADIMSKTVDWKDRNTCVLFGDGAGAALLSENTDGTDSEIIDSMLRSEGQGARYLERTAGGTRFPFSPENTREEDLYLKMDGRQVYMFAVRVLCDTIEQLLSRNGITIDDLKYIVPHQANVRIIEAAAKRSNISMDKFYLNIDKYANTSAATIPIALAEMTESKLLTRGDLVLTIGFGGGLTYGGNLIRW